MATIVEPTASMKDDEATDVTREDNGWVTNITARVPRLKDFYISEKTGFLIEHPLVWSGFTYEYYAILEQ